MKNVTMIAALLALTLTSTLSFAQHYDRHDRRKNDRRDRPSAAERIRRAQRIFEQAQREFERNVERNRQHFSNQTHYENGYDTELYGHGVKYGSCGDTGYVDIRRTQAGTYACFPTFRTGQVSGTAVDPLCCN